MTTQARKDEQIAGAKTTVERLEAKQTKLRGELGSVSTKLDRAKARVEWLAQMPADDATPAEDSDEPTDDTNPHADEDDERGLQATNNRFDPDNGKTGDNSVIHIGGSRRRRGTAAAPAAQEVTTAQGTTEREIPPPPDQPDPVFPPDAGNGEQ